MILVTGASGNVGRPLVELLVAAGESVRAVTRDPVAAGLPGGVDVVTVPAADPDSVAAALDGVTAVFVNPRAVGPAAADFLAVARERGVRRVVGLAAINVEDDLDRQPSRFRGDRNREVEQAVTESGLDWVSLRPTTYAVNAIGQWAAQIRAGDVVRTPFPAAAGAPIHERDVAAVAAHALTTDDLLGTRIPLTGPEWLTNAEQVDRIGQAIGKPLRTQQIPVDTARRGMVATGAPEPFADAVLAYQATLVDAQPVVLGDVAKILGRPARTFAEWAADHAADFRPQPA